MKRLENGLIENLNYVRDEETGRINWLKMIPEKYLYINQDKMDKIKKRLNKSKEEITIADVEDTEKVITLQGIRYALDLRGYKKVSIKVDKASQDYAAATSEITFIPNEEEAFEQVFTACACAWASNTKSFYQNYLIEAASNRALCRAVRNFLKINIISNDELGGEEVVEESPPSSIQPIDMLSKLLIQKNITFNQLKEEYKDESAAWKELKDIPKPKILYIMGKIRSIKPKESDDLI